MDTSSANKSLVKNSADPQQVKDAKEKELRGREKELKDLCEIANLHSGAGLRLFWRLLHRSGMFNSSYAPDNRIYFLEGERNIGLYLQKDLNDADPEIMIRMLKLDKGERK